MGIELQMVAGTVGVLFLLLMYQGSLVPLNQGFAWGLGSRDAKQDHTAMQGRAARTVANHIEGMMLFIPLVVIIEMSNLASSLTAVAAVLYLVGRVAYAPLYLMGVPYLRSLAWAVSLTGIVLLGFVVVGSLF